MKYEDYKDKPLPDHTELRYDECLAKLVLEEFFPNEFASLKICDKPDLQDKEKNIGVEVTKAVNPIQKKNESLYAKICYGVIHNKENEIKKINASYKPHSIIINSELMEEGDRYGERSLLGIPEENNFDRITKSFEIKLNKINGQEYEIFKSNYFFIFSDVLADEIMIDDAIKSMNQLQSGKKIKINKVYVYVPHYIYVLNLEHERKEIIEVRRYQDSLANKAREMVILREIG